MSNNKQSSVEWLRQELLKRDMDVSIKELIEHAKAMHKEEMQTQYQDGREAVIIESIATLSTIKASSYSNGFNDGYMKALDLNNKDTQ